MGIQCACSGTLDSAMDQSDRNLGNWTCNIYIPVALKSQKHSFLCLLGLKVGHSVSYTHSLQIYQKFCEPGNENIIKHKLHLVQKLHNPFLPTFLPSCLPPTCLSSLLPLLLLILFPVGKHDISEKKTPDFICSVLKEPGC